MTGLGGFLISSTKSSPTQSFIVGLVLFNLLINLDEGIECILCWGYKAQRSSAVLPSEGQSSSAVLPSRTGQSRNFWNAARASSGSCTWEGRTWSTTTRWGSTCWKAALLGSTRGPGGRLVHEQCLHGQEGQSILGCISKITARRLKKEAVLTLYSALVRHIWSSRFPRTRQTWNKSSSGLWGW